MLLRKKINWLLIHAIYLAIRESKNMTKCEHLSTGHLETMSGSRTSKIEGKMRTQEMASCVSKLGLNENYSLHLIWVKPSAGSLC